MDKPDTHKITKVRTATKVLIDDEHRTSGLPRVEVVHRAMVLYRAARQQVDASQLAAAS